MTPLKVDESRRVSFWKIDELCYTEGGKLDMKDEDSYGSAMRTAMKKSMSEPAKPNWHQLNKLEPRTVKPWVLAVFMLAVLAVGVGGVYLFNVWEGLYR